MKILIIVAAGIGVGLVMTIVDSALGINMNQIYGPLPTLVHNVSSMLCGGAVLAIVNAVTK